MSKQYELMGDTISLERGLAEAFRWYISNKEEVVVKPYMQYIDEKIV